MSELELICLSQQDLLDVGIEDSRAIVQDVMSALEDYARGYTFGEKLAVTRSRADVFNLCNTSDEKKAEYADRRLAWKLNSLVSINGSVSSVKLVGANVLNKERGYPRSESLIVLYDSATARPICLMRGTKISAARTGAYSAIFGNIFLKEESNVLGLVGSGVIAESCLESINSTIPQKIKDVLVYSRTEAHRKEFAERMNSLTNFNVYAVNTVQDCVGDADYIVSATNALNPLVYSADIKEKAVYLLLGGDEAEHKLIEESDLIVCDDFDHVLERGSQALAHCYGELSPKEQSKLRSKVMNLGNILLVDNFPAENYKRIFGNCVGLPVCDMAVASRLYQLAVNKNHNKKIIL